MKRIVVTALLLWGCAGPGGNTGGWTKEGAGQAEFDQDRRQCQAQGMSNPNAPSVQAADLYISCMRGHGWRRGAQEADEGKRRNQRCGFSDTGFFSCSLN